MRILPKLLITVLVVTPICRASGDGGVGSSVAFQAAGAGTQSAEPIQHSGLVLAARLQDGYFQVRRDGEWQKVYIAGVDIGPAPPGHFSTDPPFAQSVYADWLRQIGAMGANCVRVYTLLPSGFYRALFDYNAGNPRVPIYLFQEIWLKNPPDDNLFDAAFTADFEKDMRDVVDAIHGRQVARPGNGEGGEMYSADVSPYVHGWLVGREIEPRVVIATSLRNPEARSFEGRYLRIADGNPAEIWLTQRCDALVAYETEKYRCQRPVAFVNWPPLDPLVHPTESPLDDEWRMRRSSNTQDGRDLVSLDEERISPQPAFAAGFFAFYHLYPFYPEFIYQEPKYRQARDRQGLNPYWGYLQDLKEHFQKTPFVVGEYGLSTSIGVAHLNPEGWNHGGLDETRQGEVLARLTENIKEAGFAGGLIFEWMDEWWKHSWIAADFNQPPDRGRYWHNEMDPEESFGIMKFVPARPLSYVTLASASSTELKSRRKGGPPIRSVRVAADYSALYIDLELNLPSGAEPDWKKLGYVMALNTCGAPCGAEELPGSDHVRATFGANFVVRLEGSENARLLIARTYNPYHDDPRMHFNLVRDEIVPAYFYSAFDPNGGFEEMNVVINEARHSRPGTFFPRETYSRSALRQGVFDASDPRYDSTAQWYFDKASRRIRLRLSWGLLLVLDPSQGLVFSGTDRQAKPFGRISDQIAMAVVAVSGARRRRAPKPVQIVAKSTVGKSIAEGWSFPWSKWYRVDVQMTPKRSYQILTDVFRRLTGYPGIN